MSKQLIKILAIVITCTTLDQIHKITMLNIYGYETGLLVKVTDFFNLVMVWNRGVSFGMFGGAEYSNLIFCLISSAVSLFLIFFAYKTPDKVESILMSIIAGGAIGNILDRIFYGAVADFFDFHINNYHWPAFNIADSFITVATISLMFYLIFIKKEIDKK